MEKFSFVKMKNGIFSFFQKFSRKEKITIFVITILLAGFIFGVVWKIKHKNGEEEKEVIAKRVSVLQVGDDQTKNAIVTKTLKISSENEAQVFAEYSGRIVEDNFQVGEMVKKGQVLAKFDQSYGENSALVSLSSSASSIELAKEGLENKKEMAEKEYKMAKNDVELAKIDLEEAKAGTGSMSVEEAEENLEKAKRNKKRIKAKGEQEVEAAEDAIKQAEAGYQTANISYQKTIIRAPIGGMITQKNISNNTYVSSGALVFGISGGEKLESTVYLSSEEVENLKAGDAIQVECDGSFSSGLAKVKNIATVPNSSNLRFAVLVEFIKENDVNGCLSVNKFVKGDFKIPVPSNSGEFFLPLSAVKIGQNKNTVFVVENGFAKLREVEIGEVFGEFVKIKNGVSFGEEVAVQGSKSLQDGDLVQVLE